MNSDLYKPTLLIKSTSILSGEVVGEWAVGDTSAPVPWHNPIIKAFLDDDDIQELAINSSNIGFVKTMAKKFRREGGP